MKFTSYLEVQAQRAAGIAKTFLASIQTILLESLVLETIWKTPAMTTGRFSSFPASFDHSGATLLRNLNQETGGVASSGDPMTSRPRKHPVRKACRQPSKARPTAAKCMHPMALGIYSC
ncbi:hypothetical protein TWF696_001660 [Orbilia brochopaga]|uniref:Uncharacterized protein n=1 Tax=Orbilia brochopaga TaxID=3140254 RepID=A0AAV9U9T5_9PEZI